MNERIQDIAEHCDFYVGNEWYMESPEEKQRIWTEKFAELIVQECASICYNSGFADPDAHAQNLLFHFNVDDCRNDK
jgi:hypothetical protein